MLLKIFKFRQHFLTIEIVMLRKMSTQEVSLEKNVRNAADFHPNIWGDHFLTCPSEVIKHLITNYIHS
ncbi:hypothetical protein WN943_001893 [Citrus x changshan-huyou]